MADLLNLNKWAKVATFQLWLAKCLTQVFAIFEKVYEAAVHIKQDTNYRTNLNTIVSDFWDVIPCFKLFLAVNIVIFSPFSISKNITSFEVDAPHVFLSTQVLVD